MKKIHLFVGFFSFLIGIIIYITIYILYDSDDERICLNKKIRVQMRCIDVYTAGKNRVEENKLCIIFIRKQLLNFVG